MLKQTFIAVVSSVVASIVVVFFLVQLGTVNNQSFAGTRFENGLSADSTEPSTGEVRGTTLTITSTGSLAGALTLNAGYLRSYTNATSTVASMSLQQSDILNYDTVVVTPTGAAAGKTFTFPATSTLTSFVPTAGDMAEQCWLNATTTAATTLIFAAGTGIDLEVATSTSQTGAFDLTLGANNMGCFTYIRKANTDIHVGFLEYSDAD